MQEFLRSLDPKVWKPFAAGLLAAAAHWAITGTFDRAEVVLLALDFGYGLIGYTVRNQGSDERESVEHRALEADLR